MEIIIQRSHEDASQLVARLIADTVAANPASVLGLATGRTMEAVYRHLTRLYQTKSLDFSRVVTFNLDEYIGLPPEHPCSYRYYMDTHLFRHINIDPANTHVPNGLADDLDEECNEYEAEIEAVGGIDLQLLGLGRSGHIGFNEPLSALLSRTRTKALSPETIAQNSSMFPPSERMPTRAITVGVGTILQTKRCVLIATGEEKASVVAKAFEGPITSMISASALQLHPKCTVIVDEEAARCLEGKDYYRRIFATEPEWASYR